MTWDLDENKYPKYLAQDLYRSKFTKYLAQDLPQNKSLGTMVQDLVSKIEQNEKRKRQHTERKEVHITRSKKLLK